MLIYMHYNEEDTISKVIILDFHEDVCALKWIHHGLKASYIDLETSTSELHEQMAALSPTSEEYVRLDKELGGVVRNACITAEALTWLSEVKHISITIEEIPNEVDGIKMLGDALATIPVRDNQLY